MNLGLVFSPSTLHFTRPSLISQIVFLPSNIPSKKALENVKTAQHYLVAMKQDQLKIGFWRLKGLKGFN